MHMFERVVLEFANNRYRPSTAYTSKSIEYWTHLLTQDIHTEVQLAWFFESLEKAQEGSEFAGGEELILFLEDGMVIVRHEDAPDEQVAIGCCELTAYRQLLRDWAQVLEEQPVVVTLVQEDNRIYLLW